jgi:RND family efflux transporter MFP subunit
MIAASAAVLSGTFACVREEEVMRLWVVRIGAAVATMLTGIVILNWPAEVASAPSPSAPALPPGQTPSQVTNARPEGALTTVTLTPEAEMRLGVELATIERRNVQRTRIIGGEVIVPPGRSMTVSAPFAGVVLTPENGEVPLAGVQLGKGDVVLRVQPLPADVDVLRLRSDARYVEEQVKQARDRANRARDMYAKGEMSRTERDAAERYLQAAEALQAPANSLYSVLEGGGAQPNEQMSAVAMAAPSAGLLQNLHTSAGRVVALGDPLFEIVSQNQLWIKVPVYAGDLNAFDTTASVRAIPLGGRETGPGVALRPVSGPRTGDPRSASIDVFYTFDNGPGRFRPGERVRVTMPLRGATQGTVVPLSAIFRDIYDGAWVYENTAPRTYVRRRVNVLYVVDEVAVIGNGPPVGTKVVSAAVAEIAGTEFGMAH